MKKKQPKRFKTLPLYIVFWAVLGIMFAGLIITQVDRYNALRAELDRIESDIAREEAIYQDFQSQLIAFDNEAHMEMLARERLGMIRINEIVFRNIAE